MASEIGKPDTLIIPFPKVQTKRQHFYRDGEFKVDQVSEKMHYFVLRRITELKGSRELRPEWTLDNLKELIKNSYDSFSHCLEQGRCFILKTVVRLQEEKIIIKLSDNGDGFRDEEGVLYEKGREFKWEMPLMFHSRKGDEHYGKYGFGLDAFICEARKTGEISMKNRKGNGFRIKISLFKPFHISSHICVLS